MSRANCEIVRLGDLITDASYGTSVKCFEDEVGVPVLRMGNVRYDGDLDLADMKYAPLTSDDMEKWSLQPGDILFNRTNSKELVGKTGLWDGRFPAAAASYFIRVRVNQQRVLPEWVWRFLNAPSTKRRLFEIARGAIGQANINGKELKALPIPLPPLDEQRRIVDILNHAASIRRLREDARAKVREIIPALFVGMFGDPATNPKGWECKQVGEVISGADYGSSKKCSEIAGRIPVIRMGNVAATGELLLGDLKYADFDGQEFEKLRLEQGDILFNRTNSKELVGKTGIWDGRFDAVAASYFIRVRVRRDLVHPTYFWAFFNGPYMKRRLYETARGAIGQANINAKELKAFPIPVPPVDIQQEFADRIAEVEGMAALHDRAATGAERMAQSLLSRVFDQEPSTAAAETEAA